MRLSSCSITILGLLLSVTLIALVGGADTADIKPETDHSETITLHKGEVVTWSWTAAQYDLDFLIKDPDTDTFYEVFDKASDSGSFTTTISGDWIFTWINDREESETYDYTISLDYTIDVANSAPTAIIQPSVTNGVAPLEVVLNASGVDSDGDIVSYSWNLSDGTTSTDKVLTHTFTDPGTYEVNLTVVDDDGASGSTTIVITVVPLDPVIVSTSIANGEFDIALDVEIIIEFSLPMDTADVASKISITPSMTIAFSWSDGDTKVTLSFSEDLAYFTTYSLTIGKANATNGGSLVETTTISFTTVEEILNNPPTATIEASVTSGLAPLEVDLTGTGLDGDGTIVSYSWDLGDGTTSTDQTLTHTFTDPGTYDVTLTVVDDDGASGSASVEITVNPIAPVIVSTSLESGAVNVGVDVNIIVVFSIPMDEVDVASKTSILPSVTINLDWSNVDTELNLSFIEDLAYSTSYTLTIGMASAANGGVLAQDHTITFTTEAELIPTIEITSPPEGKTFEEGAKVVVSGTSTNIPQDAEINVTFGDVTKKATVGADGDWSVEFKAPKTGKQPISAGYEDSTSGIEVTVEKIEDEGSALIWIVIVVVIVIVALLALMLLTKKGPTDGDIEE
jgi:PKD repeat protein